MSLPVVIAISMALSHSGHMPNGGVQSSMVFPDERSFYTARIRIQISSLRGRKISLREYLLY